MFVFLTLVTQLSHSVLMQSVWRKPCTFTRAILIGGSRGGVPGARPLWDPILSFSHTFSPKSSHVRGPHPPCGKSWIRHWYLSSYTMQMRQVHARPIVPFDYDSTRFYLDEWLRHWQLCHKVYGFLVIDTLGSLCAVFIRIGAPSWIEAPLFCGLINDQRHIEYQLTHTKLVNVNTNNGNLNFLNMAPLQYFVFAPGAPIRINKAINIIN